MIQYHILQTNIKRTVWQRVRRITNEILRVKGLSFRQTYILLKVKHCSIWQHKLLPFEIPSIQCIPFLVIKFTSIVTLIMALKWLEILENSFTCGDQNKGEHCSCFPVYFEILKSDNYCHFWLYFANVLLWLNLPNFLYKEMFLLLIKLCSM